MNTFLFIPTMRCNLACPYCHFKPDAHGFDGYGKFHKIDVELPWWQWLRDLERFRPYFLEFTGGEPLMWKNFKVFIAHLPYDAKWAITSNTLLDVSGIDLAKCVSWTASFHYGQSARFIENLECLGRCVKPSVSLVVEKARLERALVMARYFAGRGYRVNLLRQLTPDIDWRIGSEWDALKQQARQCGYNLVEDDIPPAYEFPKGFYCEAGTNYFCAMPDGKVYRCYSQAMLGEPLGSMADFEPLKEATECHVSCLGCAKDFAARKKKIDDKNSINISVPALQEDR